MLEQEVDYIDDVEPVDHPRIDHLADPDQCFEAAPGVLEAQHLVRARRSLPCCYHECVVLSVREESVSGRLSCTVRIEVDGTRHSVLTGCQILSTTSITRSLRRILRRSLLNGDRAHSHLWAARMTPSGSLMEHTFLNTSSASTCNDVNMALNVC